MKKKIIITLIGIIMVIGLLITINSNNKKVYTEIDGVKYAILVNGVSANSFPSGNYKVDVNCTNAYGYWDNITHKLILKDITGSVTCNVAFNSKTNDDNLNNYVMSLSGDPVGDGKVIHEIGEIANFNDTSIITSYGTTPVYFRNTSNTSTSQTSTGSYWTFSNGTFTSVPSTFTASGTSSFYHVYAQVSEAGYYKICYTINQSSITSNRLYISKNTTNIGYISPSSSGTLSSCLVLGYLTSTDYINISEKAYSRTSSPVMTFRIEKSNSLSEIDTGYRYEGNNPDNYIMFNNELWRIIGVFETEYDSDDNGTTETTGYLVKIIRADSIGNFSWNKNEINDWSSSTLYHLLNEQYYDWETNKTNVNNNCIGYVDYYYGIDNTMILSNCDYSINGIQDDYRGMIVNSKWYLGGSGKNGYSINTADFLYSYERDNNAVYVGTVEDPNVSGIVTMPSSTTGYIGLMYASDFLYGALESDCPRTTTYSYNNYCYNDWVDSRRYEWTITPSSGSSNSAFYFFTNGLSSSWTNYGQTVRPVVYLSPSVYRVGGSGSMTDPYIIGMPTS